VKPPLPRASSLFCRRAGTSIRFRLTLLYSGILASTLLLFTALILFFTTRLLAAEVDRSLVNQAVEISRSAVLERGTATPLRLVLPDPNTFAAHEFYIQVLNREGEVIGRSRNLGPLTLPARSGDYPRFETVSAGETPLRVYYHPLGPRARPLAVIQVARSLGPLHFALTRLRFVLLFLGLAAAAGSAFFGWLLAGSALRPIEELTRAAREIGEKQDFRRRVDYRGPEDELGRLARTFNQMLGQLEEAYERLATSYGAQRRFLADVSHQLRTPLTIIRGNVELLREKGESHPEIRAEALADMASEAEKMSRLVQDLLLLARADAGLRLDRRPFALRPLLEEVGRKARVLAARHSFSLDLRLPEELTVEGDPDYFEKLLFILLENAFRYTPPGEEVSLSARVSEKQPSLVTVTVADTGPGIAEEDLPHVFERFYRGKEGRGKEGSGLGLAIARWIAEGHGATIRAENREPRGVAFVIELPFRLS
jgi:signal transduction histidine kinase